MGLRRTTTTSVPLQFRSIRRSAAGAVSPSQEKVVEAAASTTTAPVQVVLSSSASSSRTRRSAAGGGGAQAVDDRDRIAATKPPRALSTRTRHSRKGVGLAAAASSATAAASPGPGVADPSRDPQDGMAPALTEPTAVPTQAANTKGQEASGGDSPQPEIFEVADHHPMAAGDHEHVAGTETSNSKMGLGGGERERQPMKASKRTKKDELPLKELRSTRRRSNLQSPGASVTAPAVTPARPVNGKSPRVPAHQQKQKEPKERWVGTTGGNGGTVKATAAVVDVPVALENVKQVRSRKGEAAVENSKEETTTPPSSNSGPSEEGTRQENGQAEEKTVVQDSFVNTTETQEEDPPVVRPGEKDSERLMEPSSMDQEDEVVVNNNNYLDKNRVPIIMNSAVKEEGDEGQGVAEEKIGDTTTTTTNGPESNSEPPPVILRAEEEGKVEQQQEVAHQEQGEDVPQTLEGEVVREESTQPVVEEVQPLVEEQGQVESSCVVSEEPVWTKPSEVDQVQEDQVQQGLGQEELRVPPIIQPETTTDPEPVSTEPEHNVPSNPANDPSDHSLATSTPLLPLLLPQDVNPCSAVEQFKAMSSDAALLEELLLTTPTKNLTEQLCMVLKDQERALDQQEQEEQQAQQQSSSSSQPSSQTILKETAEMEEMLGDLDASELDLLQVFKSFESGPVMAGDVATGTEGNLLSLLVAEDEDVDMMMSAVSANESPVKCLPPLVNSSAVPARVSAADKEAQDQEQDMRERKKMLSEMEQELSQMQRRRDFLLRRLRKQQVHHMGRQLSEEVVGLFELSARAASCTAPPPMRAVTATDNNHVKYLSSTAPTASQNIQMEDVEELTPASIVMRTESPPTRADVKARLDKTAVGHHPFIKPPSPKSIRTFVQKVVASQVKEQPGTTSPVATGSNSNNLKSSSNKVGRPPTLVLPSFSSATASSMLDDGHRLQLTSNVGLLKTELRIVEQAIDSEATASSSGGESADELINYSNVVQESLAIADRAAWRWAQERARLASRWNWLMAEISDLEYRIRQHTDLHNQLRKSKGPVLLLRPNMDKGSPATAGQHGSVVAAQTTTGGPANVNGYRGLLPGQYSSAKMQEAGFMADVENEIEGTSSRTRPYNRTAFKKRKLVQTMNLHTISKKAARPSSIKCGCQWPQQPCALCTGRSDPTIPRPLPDMIPKSQRAALLDSGLHPCLSFPEDVSQSIRCEAVFADPHWQQKVLKSSKSALKSSIVAAAAAAGGQYKGLKLMEKKKEVDVKMMASTKYTQGLISRYKKSKSKNRGTHTKYVHMLKQQKSQKATVKAGLSMPLSTPVSVTHCGVAGSSSLDVGEYESGVARSRNASPTHNYYRQDRIERRSRNSYDIDNIVIPYSVAASTRVEILPYKEIPTPKWNLVDETDLDEDIQVETNHYQQQQQAAASSDSNSSTITALEFDCEEFLEEYIQEKHLRALLEERKKFSTFLKFPYSTRSRANRRIDSRAESTSGANTPDPASPAPHTPSLGGDQESIPSPLCPSTPALESVLESEASSQGPSGRLANTERRRTISLKMLSHQNSTASDTGRPRSQTPEPSAPPFERLDYPLSDRKYEDMLKQMPLNHERLDLEGCNQRTSLEEVGRVSVSSSVGSGSAAKKARRVTVNDHTVMLVEEEGEQMEMGVCEVVDDSETESLESPPPEDPDDPEWVNAS